MEKLAGTFGTLTLLLGQVSSLEIRSGLFKAVSIKPDMWQDPKLLWANSGALAIR